MQIYDVTLRDGAQSRDASFTVHDKLEILKALDAFGADYVELGWPGSNAKDMEAFITASELRLTHAKVAAFASTRRKGIAAEDDRNLKAVIESRAPVCSVFGKTVKSHIRLQLVMSLQENLEAIHDSISFLRSRGLLVFFDAEHFFDGFKDVPDYALQCLKIAASAGADTLVLCDTNGGCLPDEVYAITREVRRFLIEQGLTAGIGIHCHNDSGCAAANTLAVADLVNQVQVTVNGLGERSGNADLCQVLPGLTLKKGIALPHIQLRELTSLSRLVYTLGNIKPLTSQPYVGRNAFSHKGGIHVDALLKGASYEHVDPSLVGNCREIVLSELSGRATIVDICRRFGIEVAKDDARVGSMLSRVEQMEQEGYDIAELPAEHFLLVQELFRCQPPPFTGCLIINKIFILVLVYK